MILMRECRNIVSCFCFAFNGSPILSTGRNEQDVGCPWVPKRITFDWIQRPSPSTSCSREQIWTWQRELIGHPSGPTDTFQLGTVFLRPKSPNKSNRCHPHRMILSLTASKSWCFAVFSPWPRSAHCFLLRPKCQSTSGEPNSSISPTGDQETVRACQSHGKGSGAPVCPTAGD